MTSKLPETLLALVGLFALGMVSVRSAETGRSTLAMAAFALAMATVVSFVLAEDDEK